MNLFELENYKKNGTPTDEKKEKVVMYLLFSFQKSFPSFFPLSTLTQLAEGKTKQKSIRLGQEKRGNIVHALSIF